LACKVKLREGETTDVLISRFKTLVKKSNILADVRKHEFFLKKSLKRKRKSEEARKLARRKGR
jgi:small subunit ribosomal protein S21